MNVTRLNHAVLYVRDARRTSAFYQDVLGFDVVIEDEGGAYVFLRAGGSENHHDLALFSIGEDAADPQPSNAVRLYHIAWEVATIEELIAARASLLAAGALVGESDHGVNKSLYAKDPDGLEFEVMYLVPSEEWGDDEHRAIIAPLDLAAESRMERERGGG